MFGGFDPFQMMNHQMREMDNLMGSMMEPFGMESMMPGFGFPNAHNPRQQMINDSTTNRGGNFHQHANNAMLPFQGPNQMMNPFGGFFGGGGFMTNIVQQMQSLQDNAMNDANSVVYSESKVINMAPDASGRMRTYESSNSVRKHGDVKETRRTVRDSARGVEEMAIGHHIGQRGHVIEKRRRNGGPIEEEQQFLNMGQNHAETFDREWANSTRNVVAGGRQIHDDKRGHLSIDYTRGSDRERHASPYVKSRNQKKKGPIIEEAD